jgi:hypothetical protein
MLPLKGRANYSGSQFWPIVGSGLARWLLTLTSRHCRASLAVAMVLPSPPLLAPKRAYDRSIMMQFERRQSLCCPTHRLRRSGLAYRLRHSLVVSSPDHFCNHCSRGRSGTAHPTERRTFYFKNQGATQPRGCRLRPKLSCQSAINRDFTSNLRRPCCMCLRLRMPRRITLAVSSG